MFEHFEKYITTQASFTPEELKLMRALSTEKKIRRKQLLLQEGEICRHKIFVVKGLLRMYRTKDDGTEYNMRFAAENYWVVDPVSYNKQQPTQYRIEAMEDTTVLSWSMENIEKIFAAVPAFKSYSEKLKTNSLEASQDRVLMNISSTAEEKYQEFITSFPEVFKRIPLHMVASYLGVSRETLSRVRHAQLLREKEME